MSLDFLAKLRQFEFDEVKTLIPARARLLELGAGAGWQARALAELGHDVAAIDVEGSTYEGVRVWPISIYDGHHIPFADREFDVVFSSNVLEHVPHQEEFQREIKRVLKPGGLAIHILPSGSWRFWTIMTHYPWYLKETIRLGWQHIAGRPPVAGAAPPVLTVPSASRKKSPLEILGKIMIPRRHGERGNLLTEIYYFSRRFWVPFFVSAGWKMVNVQPNRLFYTGNSLFDSLLPIALRSKLGSLFGSSCIIYVMRLPDSPNDG
jgi:SAM-dependent methyltransferase